MIIITPKTSRSDLLKLIYMPLNRIIYTQWSRRISLFSKTRTITEAIADFLRPDYMWKTKQVKGDVSFDFNISDFE